MAAVIDATTDQKVYVNFDITKSEENADGDLVVFGKATDGSVDTDQQIVDPEWSAKAIRSWLDDGGTLRVQHNPKLYPAGKGLEVETTPNGHYVKALVVEPTAQRLVRAGALRAFSVGIAHPVIERDMSGKARGGIIRGNEKTSICEISLVDSPANKNCGFTLVKGENVDADWEFGNLDELLEKSVKTRVAKAQPEDRKDTEDAGRNEQDAEEGTNDDPDSDEPQGPASKGGAEAEWRGARHAWLQREPMRGDAADGTQFLAKRAAWQRWWAEGEQQGLTDDGYPVWAAKRDMDPSVGGGVDRDKIPAEDFAGKDRSFPIVSPQDVADAARSIGRAGGDNYTADQLKANIIRIAKRKGAEFEAKLPDAWKDGGTGADSDKAAKPKGGAVQCKDCNTYNKAGSGKCKGCGKPVGDDASEKQPAEKLDVADGVEKAGGKTCPKCSKVYHADSKVKFCKKCGTKLPGGSMKSDEADTEKTRRALPSDTRPAGEHREPDGTSTVEMLEPQAGLGTDADKTPDKVPASVKSAPTYALTRAHDALCAAYHAADVLDAYPTLKSITDALDPGYWETLAAEKAEADDLDAANDLVALAKAAKTLKAEDADLVADARMSLHKSFTSLYPTANIKPSSDAVRPGMFNRPFISAGHAPLNAGSSGPSVNVPPSTHVPEPGDFTRGPLTAGEQRPSPGNKAAGGNNPTGVDTGAVRTYYAARARDAARNMLTNLHDHIAATYPDTCVLAPANAAMPSRMGATNVPSHAAVSATKPAPGEKSEVADLVKSLVAEHTTSLRDEYETEIAALKAEIHELGKQPDPAQAPPRGAVRKSEVEATATPVEKAAADAQRAEKAAKERSAYIAYLTSMTQSGDPTVRQDAETVLLKYLTP